MSRQIHAVPPDGHATFTGAASHSVHMNILERHMKQKIAPSMFE
jgi:hypothetical protein